MPVNPQAHLTAPDWVMLGVQGPDGVQVFASTDLTRAQLEAHVTIEQDFTRWWDGPCAPPRYPGVTTVELAATMGTVVMATGRDYIEALRTMFEHWSPEGPDRTPIEPARPELTP